MAWCNVCWYCSDTEDGYTPELRDCIFWGIMRNFWCWDGVFSWQCLLTFPASTLVPVQSGKGIQDFSITADPWESIYWQQHTNISSYPIPRVVSHPRPGQLHELAHLRNSSGAGLNGPWGSLQTPDILWFCDCDKTLKPDECYAGAAERAQTCR